MTDIVSTTLKEIVTEDFRAASVFEKYALDFCCRGGKTIGEACQEKELDSTAVIEELKSVLTRAGENQVSFSGMTLPALIAHILVTHHEYVKRMLPTLLAHTAKVATVHGQNHPEVVEVARIFANVASDLDAHLRKEERILFPYITSMALAAAEGKKLPPPPFGSVGNPIRMMESEHESAGDALYEIRNLTGTYAPPADACTTYRVTYQELQEFERDLHQHVRLENNLLFPGARGLEASFGA
jgi:regulator of cell morphogenesis and NO signaling